MLHTKGIIMEIVVALFIIVGGSIALSAWLKSKSADNSLSARQDDPDKGCCVRTCLACGYKGEMRTWLAHYIVPKLIVIAGFLLGYIPGLIFLAIYWGKYKCPGCGAVGKNQQTCDH